MKQPSAEWEVGVSFLPVTLALNPAHLVQLYHILSNHANTLYSYTTEETGLDYLSTTNDMSATLQHAGGL